MKRIIISLAILVMAVGLMSGCGHCLTKKASAGACCSYAGSAACCGNMAPDAKIACAGCDQEIAAKDALKVGDGKYACAHCAVKMGR